MLVVHVCGFFATLIPFWVLATKSVPAKIFFIDSKITVSGPAWGSLVWLEPGSVLIGPDSGVLICKHFELNPWQITSADFVEAEDIRGDSRVLPMEVMWIVMLYGFTGSIMELSFCVCMSNIEDTIKSPTGQP